MKNFALKEFVEQNLPDFNPKSNTDLIKAEKLLKAESKINHTFTINEIESFIEFIKNNDTNFDEILKLPVINSIYNDIYPTNVHIKPDLRFIAKEVIKEFREPFSANLKAFLHEAVKKNQWLTLISFYQYYSDFFDVDSLEFLKNSLHERNKIIIEGIYYQKDLITFKKNYPFLTDKKFYFLQSIIDDFEFDDDILSINNVIAEKQKTNPKYKVILGEILLAIFNFNSPNEITKNVIRDNQPIAKEWIEDEQGFFSRISFSIASFFITNKNPSLLIFLSVLTISIHLFSFLYFYTLGTASIITYIIVNCYGVFLAFKNFKYYFDDIRINNSYDILMKISATIIITLISSFIMILIIAMVTFYVIECIANNKFPSQLIFPLIFVGIKIYLSKK